MSLFYENLNLPISILCKKNIDNGCPNHFHSDVEMSLILGGHHHVIVNNKEIILEAGDILFCNPYDFHSYYSPDFGEHIFISIEEFEYCNCFPNNKFFVFPNALKNKDKNKEIFKIASDILSEQEDFTPLIRQGYINLIIGKILKYYQPIHSTTTNFLEISQVVHYINKHYREKITRSSLAKTFGYSTNYFSSIFKEYFNISISNYINTIRYEQTKLEILNGNNSTSLSEIILSNGFNSTQTYYRLNKKTSYIYNKLRNFHDK